MTRAVGSADLQVQFVGQSWGCGGLARGVDPGQADALGALVVTLKDTSSTQTVLGLVALVQP